MRNANITNKQRLTLAKAYMNELDQICKDSYGGDFDRMPESTVGLPINWMKCIEKARINTTPAGASRIVQGVFNDDELVEMLS